MSAGRLKLLTVLGTRPEIIRMSEIIRLLDQYCDQTFVFTGQNYHDELSGLFFRELQVREPDVHLNIVEPSFARQVARILDGVDSQLEAVQPDRMLLLGDTNSALCAVVAARRGVPVYHLEAGNRCYDDRVPEEINRRIIDHCSAVLLPYTQRSKDNLVREGIARDRIFVVGNPIFEVLQRHDARIEASDALKRLGLRAQSYFLATVHRAENVDDPGRLRGIFDGLDRVARGHGMPVVVSVHPRTALRLKETGASPDPERIRLSDPFGFFDFVALERAARAVLSDSGTVQEECCIFRVPNLTVRDTTERPETLEAGSNLLVGASPDLIESAMNFLLRSSSDWTPPAEYVAPHVSDTVARIVLGLSGRARG
jgi:UDP-N-acetylglucosamine 2-epimerase (non-hydrolysing)